MTIRIPDFLFAQGTGSVTAPGEVSFETRNALASAQSVEKEMALLHRGLSLAGEALKGGDKVKERLRAARDALGTRGDSGALRWLLDHAAAEQARREAVARSGTAMRKLVGRIKSVGDLPVPFAMKAELGRHLVQEALRPGLVQPEEQDVFETAALSRFGLQQAQQALAEAGEPGQALAIAQAAKAEGSLLPHDAALLERQARERDATATARHHARLARKEQDDLAAFARGELPEPLSEESFQLVHGARAAHSAQLRYQAARAQGEAMAQIRGKDPGAIAEAERAWQGDPAVFTAARSEDAAERQRDPVGYVIATQPELVQALKEASPEEAVWLLWQAQAAAGIPEGERVIWSRAQQEALADEWDAIPTDSSGGSARVDFLRRHVQSLPLVLRAAAIRTLVRQGITDGTEAELTRLVAELEDNRANPARRLATELTPAGSQDADQRDASDPVVAEAAIATSDSQTATAPTEPIDWRSQGLPDAQTAGAWTMSAYEPSRQAAIAETFDHILALEVDPANLPTVEQEIRERFAGDKTAINFLSRQSRILAGVEDDDQITGDNRRTSARELVSEARERVIAGEPYDERWAELRPTLAKLEAASGLHLRPGVGPGLIGVFEPGRDEPTFSLPLPLVELLADSPEALAEFTRLAGKLLRGEDVSAELNALGPKFIEVFEYTDEFGELHRSTDASAFDEIRAAVAGTRARLDEGAPPDEVFLHLMQVVLADELDDTDIAVVALETALELLPHYQYVEISRGAADLIAALRAGDAEAAWAAGIFTTLAAVGSVPLLGPFAKKGLGWAIRKLGWIPTPTRRSFDWLTRKASAVAEQLDVWEQKLWFAVEGDMKRMFRYLNGRRDPLGFQWEMYKGSDAFKALQPHEQAQYKSLWGDINRKRGKKAELEMARLSDSLPMYRGTARTQRDTYIEVTLPDDTTTALPLDVARLPEDSQLLRDINDGLIGTKDNPLTPRQFVAEGGYALELKSGAADLKGHQSALRDQLIAAGAVIDRHDVWFKAHMPNHEVPLDLHIDLVRKSAQRWGFSDQMVRSLVVEVRNNTPQSWPIALSVAATEMLLLALHLEMQSMKGREQPVNP